MNTANRGISLVLLVGLIATGTVVYFGYGQADQSKKPARQILTFFGKVVDQDGNPLRAEVDVQVSQMVRSDPAFGHGSGADRKPENKFTVYPGENGVMLVMFSSPNHVLEILDVKHPGYTWLKDYAWSNGPEGRGSNNEQREFIFEGPNAQFPIYTPDPNNVAVFVLVKDGFTGPITAKPSRGGSDRREYLGQSVPNQPQPVIIPSTGPSAPQGNDAINAAIREYIEKRNAPATRDAR